MSRGATATYQVVTTTRCAVVLLERLLWLGSGSATAKDYALRQLNGLCFDEAACYGSCVNVRYVLGCNACIHQSTTACASYGKGGPWAIHTSDIRAAHIVLICNAPWDVLACVPLKGRNCRAEVLADQSSWVQSSLSFLP